MHEGLTYKILRRKQADSKNDMHPVSHTHTHNIQQGQQQKASTEYPTTVLFFLGYVFATSENGLFKITYLFWSYGISTPSRRVKLAFLPSSFFLGETTDCTVTTSLQICTPLNQELLSDIQNAVLTRAREGPCRDACRHIACQQCGGQPGPCLTRAAVLGGTSPSHSSRHTSL